MQHESFCIIGIFLSLSTGKIGIYIILNVFFFIVLYTKLTVDNRRFPSGKFTCLGVPARYFAMRLTASFCKRRRLLKNMHPGVQTLIFLVFLIPKDILTYQPLPCNSIRISLLDYIRPYSVIVFYQMSLLT